MASSRYPKNNRQNSLRVLRRRLFDGRLLVRSACFWLCGLYFFTQVAFAHQPEINFWTERHRAVESSEHTDTGPIELASLPSSLPAPSPLSFSPSAPSITGTSRPGDLLSSVPLAYGSLRNVSSLSGSTTHVLHIQDVHLNQEAQENIHRTLEALIEENKVDLVALEGAFSPIDLSGFKAFPHPDIIKAVADYLFKDNKLSGPLYTLLASPNKPSFPSFVGIDDKPHYDANVEAYRESSAHLSENKAAWKALDQDLRKKKNSLLNPSLLAFDRTVEAYRENKIKAGDYVRILSKQGKPLPPSLEAFLQALSLEENLDFKRVEEERSLVISRLVKRLNKTEISGLLNYSLAYRLNRVSSARFYVYVKDLSQRSGIPLTPSLASYIRYVLLSDRINPEELIKDTQTLEEDVYASLTKTPQEKELLQESRQLELTGKLLDFSLTPPEWGEYKAFPKTHTLNLSSFESFYREAEERDRLMAEHLGKAIKDHHAKSVVLVTGGFHAEGMDRALKESGISTVSFVPRITHVDSGKGSEYLSVFTQEKTPLESLFKGERLFLTPQLSPNQGAMALMVEGGSVLHGYLTPGDQTITFQTLAPQELVSRAWVVLENNVATARTMGRDGTVKGLRVQQGPNGLSVDPLVAPAPLTLPSTLDYGRSKGYKDWQTRLGIAPWYEATQTFNPLQFFKEHHFEGFFSFTSRLLGVAFIWASIIGVPFSLGFFPAFFLLPPGTGSLIVSLSIALTMTTVSTLSGMTAAHLQEKERPIPLFLKVLASPSYAGSILAHFLYNASPLGWGRGALTIEKGIPSSLPGQARDLSDWRNGWVYGSDLYQRFEGHPISLYSMEGRLWRSSDGFSYRLTTAQGGLGDLFGGWISGLAGLGMATTFNRDSKAPEAYVFMPNYRKGVRLSRLDEHGVPISDADQRAWSSVRPQDMGIPLIADPKDSAQALKVSVPVYGIGEVQVQFRAVKKDALQVILLETDGNDSEIQKGILDRLYQGRMYSAERFRQEWIYGLATEEFKQRFNLPEGPLHLNETATFPVLVARIRKNMERLMQQGMPGDLAYRRALELVGPQVIFFTHTLVAAGVDKYFDDVPIGHYIREYFLASPVTRDWADRVAGWMTDGTDTLPGFRFSDAQSGPHYSPLNFIVKLAYRFGGQLVAVSRLNAEKARQFLSSEEPVLTKRDVGLAGESRRNPVQAVTNAVDEIFFTTSHLTDLMDLHQPDPARRHPEKILNPQDPRADELVRIVTDRPLPSDYREAAISDDSLSGLLRSEKLRMIDRVRTIVKRQYIRNIFDLTSQRTQQPDRFSREDEERLRVLIARWSSWTGTSPESFSLNSMEHEEPVHLLDPDLFTVTWARRIVDYKRMLLVIFGEHLQSIESQFRSDRPLSPQEMDQILDRVAGESGDRGLERLCAPFLHLLEAKKTQFLFAGPTFDVSGRSRVALLDRVIERLSKNHPSIQNRVVYIEGYNDEISPYLVQGSDVWLNTPRIPEEASGTSSMKGLAVPVTTRDGWAADGLYPDLNGLAIGPPPGSHTEHPYSWTAEDRQNHGAENEYLKIEASQLYETLGNASNMHSQRYHEWLNLVRRAIYYKVHVYSVRSAIIGRRVPSSNPAISETKRDPGLFDLYASAIDRMESEKDFLQMRDSLRLEKPEIEFVRDRGGVAVHAKVKFSAEDFAPGTRFFLHWGRPGQNSWVTDVVAPTSIHKKGTGSYEIVQEIDPVLLNGREGQEFEVTLFAMPARAVQSFGFQSRDSETMKVWEGQPDQGARFIAPAADQRPAPGTIAALWGWLFKFLEPRLGQRGAYLITTVAAALGEGVSLGLLAYWTGGAVSVAVVAGIVLLLAHAFLGIPVPDPSGNGLKIIRIQDIRAPPGKSWFGAVAKTFLLPWFTASFIAGTSLLPFFLDLSGATVWYAAGVAIAPHLFGNLFITVLMDTVAYRRGRSDTAPASGLARFFSPATASLRNIVGTFFPLQQAHSTKKGWGIGDLVTGLDQVKLHHRWGQNIMVILGLSVSSAGNSSYSVASRAKDAVYIGVDAVVDELAGRGFDVSQARHFVENNQAKIQELRDAKNVRYDEIRRLKLEALGYLWAAFKGRPGSNFYKEFQQYRADNSWLEDDLLYLALKDHHVREENVHWTKSRAWDWRTWEEGVRDRDPAALDQAREHYRDDIDFGFFLQFMADRQFQQLRQYARRQGVSLVLDVPVAPPDADVWKYARTVFGLKKENGYRRLGTQGVPPEPAYKSGQIWQFTLLDWSRPETEPYLLGLLGFYQEQADYLRWDHALGLFRQYVVTNGLPLGVHRELLEIRRAALAKMEGESSDRESIRKQAAQEALKLIEEYVRHLPESLKENLPGEAVGMMFDGEGNLQPHGMIMISRVVAATDYNPEPNAPFKTRLFDVEQAVFSPGGFDERTQKSDLIRLTADSQAGDAGFMEDYLFNGDPQPSDTLRLGYFRLTPGLRTVSKIMEQARKRGTTIVWELLGVLPAVVQQGMVRLGAYVFTPALWGQEPYWGETPNPFYPDHHVVEALVTLAVHDSPSVKQRWEEELEAEQDGRAKKKAFLTTFLGPEGEAWNDHDLTSLTPRVRELFLRLVYASRSNIAVLMLNDVGGLGADFRFNIPGVQNGQWENKLPWTVEDLLAGALPAPLYYLNRWAVRFLSQFSKAPRAPVSEVSPREIALLIQGLTRAGNRHAPLLPQDKTILAIAPRGGEEHAAISRLGEAFPVDAVLQGVVKVAELVVKVGNQDVRVKMEPIPVDRASYAHGFPSQATVWSADWHPTAAGSYEYHVEVDGVRSESGSVTVVTSEAPLNPLSHDFNVSAIPPASPASFMFPMLGQAPLLPNGWDWRIVVVVAAVVLIGGLIVRWLYSKRTPAVSAPAARKNALEEALQTFLKPLRKKPETAQDVVLYAQAFKEAVEEINRINRRVVGQPPIVTDLLNAPAETLVKSMGLLKTPESFEMALMKFSHALSLSKVLDRNTHISLAGALTDPLVERIKELPISSRGVVINRLWTAYETQIPQLEGLHTNPALDRLRQVTVRLDPEALFRRLPSSTSDESGATTYTPFALLALGLLDTNLLPLTLVVSLAFLVYLSFAGSGRKKVSSLPRSRPSDGDAPPVARLINHLLPSLTRPLESLGHDFVGLRTHTEDLSRPGIEVWEIRDPQQIPALESVLKAFSASPGLDSHQEAVILMAYDAAIKDRLDSLAGQYGSGNLHIVVVDPDHAFRDDQANLPETLQTAFQNPALHVFARALKEDQAQHDAKKNRVAFDLFAVTDSWITPSRGSAITIADENITISLSDLSFRLHLINRVLGLVHEADAQAGANLRNLLEGLKASEVAQQAA